MENKSTVTQKWVTPVDAKRLIALTEAANEAIYPEMLNPPWILIVCRHTQKR